MLKHLIYDKGWISGELSSLDWKSLNNTQMCLMQLLLNDKG